ncbi:hypothetical protein EJ04DRAFT_497353 [Polyplosphaeria fusca]|uniref:NACHT domain-containing protein n=1 Tax=Polyplosphaeria fusca TaxID=682080 RepID=A0A9P4UZ98_9PLEO|nr:hypothetical protein EJ04DRAFT_497353 [Polyplosphaeria fusca]
MLDPLSAVSLAGNITQFAQVGIHLVGVVFELSRTGSRTSNLHYENAATNLSDSVGGIQRALLPINGGAVPKQQAERLKALASNCTSAANELLDLLTRLKRNEDSGKWDTLRLAIANVWHEDKLKEMLKRLDMVKQEAEFEILLNVSDKLDVLFKRQKEFSQKMDKSTNDMFETMRKHRQLTEGILVGQTEAVAKLHTYVDNVVKSNVKDSTEEIIQAIHLIDKTVTGSNWHLRRTTSPALAQLREDAFAEGGDIENDRLRSIRESIEKDEERKDTFRYRVRTVLHFAAMTERLEDIAEAHKKTLQWVYEPPVENATWDSFAQWLETGSGMYWIRGKPGSGKSCLMKYLFDQRKTRELLKNWSQNKTIVTAGFFFWYAGTDIQKSQNGLMRSILLQILDQQPQLLPIAYPEQWRSSIYEKNGLHGLPVTNNRKELKDAIIRVTTQTEYPLKMCLFIDGADEFNGDHTEIIELFRTVAASHSTKLCISSRPWPVFMNAFETCPGLVLQDLTRRDIQQYVRSRLEESPGMKRLQVAEPDEAPLLVEEIVDKSSGVFLWVKLVVNSLLTGLTNNDHIADLQGRLRQLPEELEELYIYMLKRIEPLYLKQALRLIQIVQHSRRPLPSLVVSIADEFDVEGFIQCWPSRLSHDEVSSRCQAIESKIQSRCLGLVESNLQTHDATYVNDDSCLENLMFANPYPTPVRRVQFMHRTVKDFFDKPDINDEFRPYLGSEVFDFNAHSALAFASLAQLKRVFSILSYGSWPSAYVTYWSLIKECLHYACEAEKSGNPLVAILDDLENTAWFHWKKYNKVGTWIHSHTMFNKASQTHPRRPMFIALSIRHDLEKYVKYQIEDSEKHYPALEQQQLDFLLGRTAVSRTPNDRICKLLLNCGADPNAIADSSDGQKTTWQETVQACHQRFGRDRDASWRSDNDILEHLICHGADLHAIITFSNLSSTAIPIILLQRGSPRLLSMMLEREVDSMEPFQSATLDGSLWQEALRHVYEDLGPLIATSNRKVNLQDWVEIYKLLLEYQASPLQVTRITQRVGSKTQSRDISVMTVIREVFSKWEPEGAATLKAELPKDLTASLLNNSSRPRSILVSPHASLEGVTSPTTAPSPVNPHFLSPYSPTSPRSSSSTPPASPLIVPEVGTASQTSTNCTTKQAKRMSFSRMLSKFRS